MSLIQLSSEGSSNQNQNNFTCYFNRGLEIPPNSKIGLVSATLQNATYNLAVVNSSNNTFFMRFGLNPYTNRTIKVEIPVGKYTYEALKQTINLEISKKQNFLTFKKLTQLNGKGLSNDWLYFGTDCIPTVDGKGLLTGIKFVNYQVPASNTGDVVVSGSTKLLEEAFKDVPKISNYENHKDERFIGENDEKYFHINVSSGDHEIQSLKLGLKRVLNLTTGVIEEKRTKIMPVIVREYISYNCAEPTVFVVNKPIAGWNSVFTNKFIGLVSYADIPSQHDGEGLGLADAKNYNYEYLAFKVGVNFSFIGGVASIELIHTDESTTLKSKKNFGATPATEDHYYIRFYVGIEGDSGDRNGNKIRVQVAENDDFSTIVLDEYTDPKDNFIGTKAYPLVPIIYNPTTITEDADAGYITLTQNDGSQNHAFTHARILDSEVEPAGDIPYNPEKEFKNILNNTDTSLEYADSATGGEAVILWNYAGSLFSYFNTIQDEDIILDKSLSIHIKVSKELHPSIEGTIGGLLGLNELFYDFDTLETGNIKGSYSFSKTNLQIFRSLYSPSYHIQISNLPIKSFNSINHSITPTIAVLSKENFTTGQATTLVPTETHYIEINNKNAISLNELSVKITNNDNVLTSDLDGSVELICIIKS